jgi:hypothetical protein
MYRVVIDLDIVVATDLEDLKRDVIEGLECVGLDLFILSSVTVERVNPETILLIEGEDDTVITTAEGTDTIIVGGDSHV